MRIESLTPPIVDYQRTGFLNFKLANSTNTVDQLGKVVNQKAGTLAFYLDPPAKGRAAP
jgi:hypothetical protein